MSSEIARLREEIEREGEALRLLSTGFKTCASHEIIEAAYDRMGTLQDRLGRLIGEGPAVRVVVSALGFPDDFILMPHHIPIEPIPQEKVGVVSKVLEMHGSRLEGRTELFLPEGTCCTPVYPQVGERRFTIILDDGFSMWLTVTPSNTNVLTIADADLVCPTCQRSLES